MRIYIAHPYTGDEARNRARALRAEEVLRRATPWAEFFNPVGRLSESERFGQMLYVEVMDRCLRELAKCDGVVFCGDWSLSPGCRVEVQTAKRLQLPRWYGVDAYVRSWALVARAAREMEEATL